MKPRTPPEGHTPEFKGVVKKIAGRLTNRPDLEQEGGSEMLGEESSSAPHKPGTPPGSKSAQLDPDPHRRG